MPTFNQLVRKGRETSIYKSNSPAEERCLHRCSYRNPQKAQLRTA